MVNHRRPGMICLFFVKFNATFDDGLAVASTMCFLTFHTTKLAKTEFVVPGRPIGIALVFGQLI